MKCHDFNKKIDLFCQKPSGFGMSGLVNVLFAIVNPHKILDAP